MTDTLTLKGENAYANDFEIRLMALTELDKDYRLRGPGLIMGGINFAWLNVWGLSPDLLSRKLEECDFSRRLSEAAAPGGAVSRAPTLHRIPWHLPYN
jgi:hypothetical protein